MAIRSHKAKNKQHNDQNKHWHRQRRNNDKIWFNPPFLWPLQFSQFSGCWLILSVCYLVSFAFSLWKIARCSVILLLPLLSTTHCTENKRFCNTVSATNRLCSGRVSSSYPNNDIRRVMVKKSLKISKLFDIFTCFSVLPLLSQRWASIWLVSSSSHQKVDEMAEKWHISLLTDSVDNWWATRTPPKNWTWTQELAKSKQFLLLIRHLPCYSYIQSSPVKVLWVIEARKHLRKKEKIHCHLRYGYFITVNKIVMTTVAFLHRWFQLRSNAALFE